MHTHLKQTVLLLFLYFCFFAQDLFFMIYSYSSEHFLLVNSFDLELFMANVTIH